MCWWRAVRLTKTFTITNSGTATLGIGNVYTNAGGNPTNFVVITATVQFLAGRGCHHHIPDPV
jgi:hypothetical protein